MLSNWSTVLYLIGLHYNINLPLPWVEGTMSMNIMNILTWGPYNFVPLQRLHAVVFHERIGERKIIINKSDISN